VGLIGSIAGAGPWAATHSALPALLAHGVDEWALFASSRDAEGRSSIGRAALRMQPHAHIAGPVQHLLGPGDLGSFDDRGVTMACIVAHAGAQFLYYTGWMLGVTVPFYLSVGLAISTDDGRTFHRASRAPLLERTADDPFLTASPFVLFENGRWRMWYISGTGWEPRTPTPRHRYLIRYAESSDGVTWTRHTRPCLDYASSEEHAFGRPFVRYDGRRYGMWYSHRGSAYRIGYAESDDGLTWERLDDERGLAPADTGWDSEMVEYPWLFESSELLCMLYNGNGYGAAGVGLAVWDDASEMTASAS
jgi:hypothetical protein